MRVFFKMPNQCCYTVCAQDVAAGVTYASPGHPVVVFGAPHKVLKSERPLPPKLFDRHAEIGRVVFKLVVWHCHQTVDSLNAPVGSEPFSGVKGAPLWSEKDESPAAAQQTPTTLPDCGSKAIHRQITRKPLRRS